MKFYNPAAVTYVQGNWILIAEMAPDLSYEWE